MKLIITISFFLSFSYGIIFSNTSMLNNTCLKVSADSTESDPSGTKDDIIYLNIKEDTAVEEEDEIFIVVEEMPLFNGKDHNEFLNYLYAHLTYPEEAKEKGISGRVIVEFIVDEEGNVTDVKIIRGIDPVLDEEVLRVVKSSPRWTPGKQRGKPVKVRFLYPITFHAD
jgi:TonB family protein